MSELSMPTNQSIFRLPRDLLIQILLLLPSESIRACKLVSKEWKNRIDDPEFFKCFRDKSLALFYFNNIVYCVLASEGNNLQISNTINGDCNPPFTVNLIPIDLEDGDGISQFLSEPPKGIVCIITNNSHLLFYNLFTRASYTTTDAPLCEHSDIYWLCYGFGYDRYDDDCKIMWKYDRMLDDDDDGLFWVYSLRNTEWKSFKGFPYAAYHWSRWSLSRQACSFNGVLHWVFPKRGTTPEKNVIFTYDLHTCKFGEMPLSTACNRGYVKLAELGGQLCCLTRTFRVWAMREYGVSESWEMLFSTDDTSLTLTLLMNGLKPKMLYECRDGRKAVLFFCPFLGSLYWYDIDNDEVKHIRKSYWEGRSIRRTPKWKIRV